MLPRLRNSRGKTTWFAHFGRNQALFSGSGGHPPHVPGPRCQGEPAFSKECGAC